LEIKYNGQMEPRKNIILFAGHGASDSKIWIKSNWPVEIHQVFTLGITQLMEDMQFYFAYLFDERNSYLSPSGKH
jgi:hypothetical protein